MRRYDGSRSYVSGMICTSQRGHRPAVPRIETYLVVLNKDRANQVLCLAYPSGWWHSPLI